ncbi:MAG: M20 family metallopeptidase [Tissierellia bacterium]|nr:M20 family metallopeptidase [Tissierellia bacterium]
MKEKFNDISNFVDSKKEEMLEFWKDLVNHESYVGDKIAVDRLADFLKKSFEKENFDCELIEVGEYNGKTLIGTLGHERIEKPIIFSGHMDTVFKNGTFGTAPFKIENGKAYGPGCLDMKGGIVIALYVIKALKSIGYDDRPIKIIISGDEENGHFNSQGGEVILKEAKDGFCAFNMETGLVDNSLCVGRKGRTGYEIITHGIGAHAGNDFTSGINAIEEMAYKVQELQRLTNLENGTTVSVSTIHGGTISNAIPSECKIELDVRFKNVSEMEKIKEEIESVCNKTYLKNTITECNVTSHMGPFETTPDVISFYNFCNRIAQEYGFEKMESKTLGGSSDASYINMAGTPVLCSFGVKGEWNHTDREYALVDSLFERTKLIAAIILNLAQFNIEG